MRVAIIGFGVMGQCAAERLVAGGHEVVASDPAPAAKERAAELGVEYAAAPDISAQVFLLFLPGPEQIRAVVPGLLGGSGAVIVDHSTSDPETARDMAALALEQGDGWLDAPVLGRPGSVGNWALPVGGTDGALERCRPVFDCYARAVFDMGGPGNGHQVKLLNQMMFGAINAMTAEMMATADRLGLPPARLYEIITSSQAGTVSNLFKELGARISEDDFADPTFSVNLLEKDVRLGLEMARAAGLEPALGGVVDAMNKAAIRKGHGAEDTAGMWRALRDD